MGAPEHDPGSTQPSDAGLKGLREDLARVRGDLEVLAASVDGAEQQADDFAVRIETLEVELLHARRRAAVAERIKSEFLRNMTHELRTPLTAILGYADELIDGEVDPARVQHLKQLQAQGQRLREMLGDIFDLSALRAGARSSRLDAARLEELIENVIGPARASARDRAIGFEVAYLGELPVEIETDSEHLRKVLAKLLQNAVQNTRTGGVRLMVRLLLHEEPRACELQFDVVDTGQGLSPAALALAFEAFGQVDGSTTRAIGGAGLGLTVAREMSFLLGGELSAESIEGHGSVFRLKIPVGPASALELVEVDPAPQDEDDSTKTLLRQLSAEGLQGRLLFVDDGPDNRRLIAFLLRKAGLTLELAKNGLEGVEMARVARRSGRSFDLILMDLQMPVMDGFEATRLLREEGFTEPIVAITAHDVDGERARALEAGCDQFLTKPISRSELLVAVAARLRALSQPVC